MGIKIFKYNWLYFLLFFIPALVLFIVVNERGFKKESLGSDISGSLSSLDAAGGLELDLNEMRDPITSRVPVLNGDTLLDIFTVHGVSAEDTQNSIEAFSELFDPRRIKPGHEIILYYEENNGLEFAGFGLQLDPKREILVKRIALGTFEAERVLRDFNKKLLWAEGRIQSNLFTSAVSTGLPIEVLLQLIQLYSFDVDFQREIRKGDSYYILYEREIDAGGKYINDGEILYARLILEDRDLEIYRYTDFEGMTDYFDPGGKSVRKTLLKTPLPGSRITSGFGMRKSPILGYTRFHPALDFSAPSGTPVLAGGDGRVIFARYNDTYGHHIKLSHANGYETLYAHLSGYAGNIRKGARIIQGDTIGFVGNTGMSTGPHLHYEVLYQGEHINPSVLDVPPGKILEGDELAEFRGVRDRIKLRHDEGKMLQRAVNYYQ